MQRSLFRYAWFVLVALFAGACGTDVAVSVTPENEAQARSDAQAEEDVGGGSEDAAVGSSTTEGLNAGGGETLREVDAETKTQAAYMARIFEISGDLVDASTSLTIASGVRPLADAWVTAETEFGALAPPTSAQALHDGWVALASDMAAASIRFADVSETGTEPQINAAAQEFARASTDVGPASLELDVLAGELSIEVYQASGTPTDLYLADVMALTAESTSVVTRLFAVIAQLATEPSAPGEMFAIFDEITTLSADYAEIEPPADLAELHVERLRLFEELAWVGDSLQEAVETDGGLDFDQSLRLEQFSADSQQWNIAFSQAVAAALRSIAES